MAIEALTLKQIRDQYQTGYNNLPLQQVQDPQDDTGFFEDFGNAFGAAFELENSVGSFFADETRNTTNDIEEGYDVFSDIQGYEEDAYAFVGVRNSERANAIKRSIDQEKRNKEIIANAGAGGIAASMVASIFDPVDWAIAGLTGGISIVGKAGKTARVLLEATAATVATETALQTTQVTRSAEESLINIASAPIMIGAVKASQVAIKMAGKSGIPKHIDVEEAGEQIIDAMNKKVDPRSAPNSAPDYVKTVGDAGAMETQWGLFGANEQTKLAKEYMGRSSEFGYTWSAGETATKAGFKWQMSLTPIGRLVGSDSPEARTYVHAFLENGFVTKGNIQGIAKDIAVETEINRIQGSYIAQLDHYGSTKWKKAKEDGSFQGSHVEFLEEVGEAMSNGDMHTNKYIQETAQQYREILDDIKKMAIDSGLLSKELADIDEVTGAQSYIGRVYNRAAIRNDLEGFKKLLTDHFMEAAETRLANAGEKEVSLNKMGIPFDETELSGVSSKSITNDQVKTEIDSRVETRMDDMNLTSDRPDKELRDIKKQLRLEVLDDYYNEMLDQFSDVQDYLDILEENSKSFLRSKQYDYKLKVLQENSFNLKDQINKDLVDIDENLIRNQATSTVDNILSDGMYKPSKADPNGFVKNKGLANSFKRRVLTLDDNVLRPYLVKDANTVIRRNVMSVIPQIKLMQKQKSLGIKNPDLELTEVKNLVKADYLEKKQFLDSKKLVENIVSGKFFNGVSESARALGPKVRMELRKTIQEPLEKKGLFEIKTKQFEGKTFKEFVGLAKGVTEEDVVKAIEDLGTDISQVTSKWFKKYDEHLKSDLNDIEATRQLLLNEQRYQTDPNSMWNSGLRNLRSVNYMSMLGGVAISSVTDTARHGMVNGLRGAKGLFKKNLWTKTFKNIEENEIRKLGIVSENVLNKRAAELADVQEGIYETSKWEKLIGKGTNMFSKWTGMTAWNEANKQIAVGMTQDIILTAAQKVSKGQSLTPKEITRFAENGLDIDDLTRIGAMYKKYGDKIDGNLLVGNLQKWDDLEISDKFADVLRKQADMIVISPSVGDKPLWASASEIQKSMFQFQSFTFAANNRQLLASANNFEKSQLVWMGVQISLGYLSLSLKDFLKGKERDWDKDFKTNALEVVDRSGIVPMLSWGSKGLQFFGMNVRNRYEESGLIGSLLGPSVGQAERLQRVFSVNTPEEKRFTEFTKMLPFQNHPLVQVLEKYTPLGEIRNN